VKEGSEMGKTTLGSYEIGLEDNPKLYKNKVKTRKSEENKKMSRTKKIESIEKELNIQNPKKYAKTRTEHFKDITIAVLITGIICFGLGVKFQADRNTEIQEAIKEVTVNSETAKK